jgi:opacity protein-like surface antigen
MKHLLFTICLFFITGISYGQFGVAAGFGSAKGKVTGGGVSVKGDSASSFSFGVLYDSEIAENFDLQTSLGFGIGEKVGDESNNSIGIGVNLQYYISGKDNGFFIGPGISFANSLADVDTDVIKKTAFSGSIGLGYDISQNFTILGGYSTSLSNSSNIDGLKIKASGISLGLQYLF